MTRPALLSLAAVALVAVVAATAVLAGGLDRAETALGGPAAPTEAPAPAPVPAPVAEAAPTAAPTSPAPATDPAATASATPTAAPDGDVAAVQQRLTDLGYYVGAVDGQAGPATASAVQAFQKVQGLSADGVIGPNTVQALEDPVVPQLRGGPADRIEVDLDDQVLYLVEDGELLRILPISSGSGESYTTAGGGTARSLTPVGDFTVERHISGVRNAPLGTLYDPMYFYRGWAIHGSNSVPARPASHGCVRVTRADARWLFDRVPIGLAVSVYGNTNAFSPAIGETAGTDTPAGDTPGTTPDDGIQTEDPAASPTPSQPTTPPAPPPTSPPATTPPSTPPTAPPTAPPPTSPDPTEPEPSPTSSPTAAADAPAAGRQPPPAVPDGG